MNSGQPFQSDRAVDIWTTPNKMHGTGYLIGGRLILTCTHLFEKDNACHVKSNSIGVKSAKVIWKAPDKIDITLLELSEEVKPWSAITFGRLPETENIDRVEFDFLGWPSWGFIHSDNKKKATGLHIKGYIYLKDISAHGLLSLEADRSPSELEIEKAIQKADEDRKSPWQGVSGASIIVNGSVVGVLRWHQNPDRPQSLEAEPLARVYDNPEWCEILTKHEIDPKPITVKSNGLSEEEKRKAIAALLEDIESCDNKLKLFHSSEKITLKDQYIPIQVTLERRYKDKLETLGSYAEAEAELRRVYALKGSSEEEIKKTQEDWNKAKEKQNYIIVLADPGMGKSTLLRMEVCQTVEQSLKALNEGKALDSLVIPLFIRLSSLADEENLSIYEAILKRVKEVYSRLLQHQGNETVSRFLNKFLEEQLQAGKVLLLLDALDEVSLERRNKLIDKLNVFVNNYSCPIIATSRIVGYGGRFIDQGKEMEIVPFTQKQTEEYINTWFNNFIPPSKGGNLRKVPLTKGDLGGSNDLIKALKERPQISGLAQNPLLLSLICSLYQEDKLKLPARRGQIYEQAVDYMLTKWCFDNHRVAVTEAEIDTKKQILMELAYQFSKKGTEVFPLRELRNKTKDYLRRNNATDLDQKANQFITELSDKDGILQKLNRDQDYYLFLHRTFQEYFTALYLKYQIEDDEETGINLVKSYLWDYDWHETIIILAGLLDNPMVLIETIRGEKDDMFKTQLMLAGRCLGECDVIKHHQVDEIIEGVFAWWKRYPKIEFFETVMIEIGKGYKKTIYGLVSALKDEDSDVRRRAADALGNIGSLEAVEGLLSALNHEDSDVGWRAADALGNIGSLEAVEGLLSALQDKDWDVRESAAEALGKIGSDKAVEGLVSALNDENMFVIRSVEEALGEIGSDKAVEGLVSALNDEDRDVRKNAAYALGEIGTDKAVEGLLSALNDEDRNKRESAAYALGKIGSLEAVEGLLSALNDEDRNVRESAAWALGKIGNKKAVEGLLSALNDEDMFVGWSAAYALGEIGTDKAVEGLLSALNDENSKVIGGAAEALGKMGNEKAVEGLLSALNHEDIRMSVNAVFALGKMGNEKAVEGLLSALNDENSTVRWCAADALGEISTDKAVEGLLSALNDENSGVRWKAASALGNIGSLEAVETLLSALNDEDRDVRGSAASALGKIGSLEAVEGLLSALNDEDRDVRWRAAEALGNIGSVEAVEGLVFALNHEDSDVRWRAASALEKIGSLTVLEALIQSPNINLYDDDIFPVARRLAIKYSKSGVSFIPVFDQDSQD